MTEDEKFMKAALAQAKKAAAIDEVPIGCVIVYEGKIIARGYNKRNKEKNTLSHAEMNAIPSGGNAAFIYQADINDYAPLAAAGNVINTVRVTGAQLAAPLTATHTISTATT